MSNEAWPSLGLLAACCGNSVKIWNPLSEGGAFRESGRTDDKRILACAWNQSGKVLAYGGESGVVNMCNRSRLMLSMYQRSTNPEDDAARRGSVQALVYSGDGKYIISGTKEGYILFWHLKRQIASGSISDFASSSVTTLAISPDGQYLAAGSSSGVAMVYRVPHMSKVGKYYTPQIDPRRCLAFSSDLTSLLFASGDEKGRLYVWNVNSRNVHVGLDLHKGRISSTCFSTRVPTIVYTAGMDGNLSAVDINSRQRTVHRIGTPLTSMSVSESGDHIAFGTTDCRVIVYDIRQLARPMNETMIHTQRSKMAVTSVVWQPSEGQNAPFMSGCDPVMGYYTTNNGQSDFQIDGTATSDMQVDEDEPRANPPNISVGSARSSVTSNGGPGGDASGHDRLLNPENALPDTLVRMGSSHGTPLLSNSFSTEMPRKPKWGGDASRHKNQLAISNQADMMMTDGGQDPLDSGLGTSAERPLSARTSPRQDALRRAYLERPRPARRLGNEDNTENIVPTKDNSPIANVRTVNGPPVHQGKNPEEQIGGLLDAIRDLRTEMIRQRIELTQALEQQQAETNRLRKEVDQIKMERAEDREFARHF